MAVAQIQWRAVRYVRRTDVASSCHENPVKAQVAHLFWSRVISWLFWCSTFDRSYSMANMDEPSIGVAAKKKGDKPLSKRQRRKQVNDKHKWPDMPKIQSPEVRAKAYVRVAGLSGEPKKDDFDLNDPSVRFGRLLGSADQRVRHRAVLHLESYLRQKCEASGFSHLDFLKLWKALWHTLYMADKVPVQRELSQKLAKLIWCVAGTEEDDEYAARVYLDMYGDNDDCMNGEMEETDKDEPVDDDDEDSVTMEEIENTLREEFDQDEDEEEPEEMEDEEVENDDQSEDQEEKDDSLIPHCRGAHLASLFLRTFLCTVRREWGRMDKYRVDKFYTLFRMMIHEVYRYMSLRHWSMGIMRLFNDVLHEEILSQTPNGLRYHLIDLAIDELASVNTKAPMPMTEATFLDCLSPFFAMASIEIGDDSLQERVMENVVAKFLETYSFVSENPSKDNEGKSLQFDQVHVGSVADYIFRLASDTETCDRFRESLYDMHKRYLRAIKKFGKDVDIGMPQDGDHVDDEEVLICQTVNDTARDEVNSEGDEPEQPEPTTRNTKKKRSTEETAEADQVYDGDIDTPERPKKAPTTDDGGDKHLEDESPLQHSNASKNKRKKKRKRGKEGAMEGEESLAQPTEVPDSVEDTPKKKLKKKKRKETNGATNTESSPGQADASDVSTERSASTAEKQSAKKKKRKKHKDTVAVANSDSVPQTDAELSSSVEESKAREEITISAEEQVEARKAMKKKSRQKKVQSKQADSEEDPPSTGKRVKFGQHNMARSWTASMKGLRNMQVSSVAKPDKGILQNKERDSKPKHGKKPRKKAVDYFFTMKTQITLLAMLFMHGVCAFSPLVVRRTATRLYSSPTQGDILSLSLVKPLGVILEENEENQAAGVFVKEVGDSGSAAEYAESIVGCKLLSVQGVDQTQASFDDVMEAIIAAPDTVTLEFEAKKELDFAVGTLVKIVAEQEGKEDLAFEAKVGDNLRQALLDNGFEVYQGMKQKLGNCGGGGSCTFCAMDFVESQGWPERSDYEDKKLAKNPDARLACLNPIQGPCTIRKAKR